MMVIINERVMEERKLGQFNRLVYFEWKKIWKRKGTWITLAILVLFYFVMDFSYFFGSKYVEGEFMETHVEGTKIDIENGKRLKGRKIDQELLDDMQSAYTEYLQSDNLKYQLTEDYQKNVRPYEDVYLIVKEMLYGYSSGDGATRVTEEELYQTRNENVKEAWKSYGLADSEIDYWQEKENRLLKPFTYEYSQGYQNLISMSGVYRVCLLVTFLIAICMSGVFTEEHGRKTDQLILCSRLGRKQIYFAKIAAGSLFSLAVTGILLLCGVFTSLFMYGTDGFRAAIQLMAPHYSMILSMGDVFLIMSGILLLASILMSIFTMVLSEITRSNIASMAVVIAFMFVARLVPIPYVYRVVSQAWNMIPINLLKFDSGFWDLRLISIFGIKLTLWQFAPLIYVVIGILIMLAGKRIYCGYQVDGR